MIEGDHNIAHSWTLVIRPADGCVELGVSCTDRREIVKAYSPQQAVAFMRTLAECISECYRPRPLDMAAWDDEASQR